MQFSIDRDHFFTGLRHVQNLVGRAVIPVLGNVLLEAKDNKLYLTTTNLDLGIRCVVKANVSKEGSITIPVKRLASIVKVLPELTVNVTLTDETQLKIVSGSSQFKVVGIPSKEFPEIPSMEGPLFFTIDQDALKKLIYYVSFAQSVDPTRYVLNGVYFVCESQKLALVATDGRRLAMVEKDMETLSLSKEENFIIPDKTILELERLLGLGKTVRVAFTGRQLSMELDVDEQESEKSGLVSSLLLTSKVVEGQFPKYNQVIPKEVEHRVKIDRELLFMAIQRAALVISEKNNSIKLSFGENVLEIFSSSVEYGDCLETIAIDYQGPAVQIAFNPQYLMDPLKVLKHDEIFFEFKNDLSPGVVKTKPGDEKFLCMVMPLRT